MADINLICKDCGSEFIFTEGEQEFYKEKGFVDENGEINKPVRCAKCRSQRRQQRNRRF